ncbi:aminoacyl-tRNA hydrolase [Chloroflexus sp. MS-CIW-1]|jgi:PTH1 family peptidyl-tRNA hydrolase|uniref:aminoacyl-tRNA hydrolase n=1 Tax=Chloroflexus sp. MS-CIW-1 TaxID=3055768 RepID=UPI002648AEF3|nr:aminoacyl-tRNA hydrolase [Chloroflexus sp. MS-CIW-1]MDN5273557.1 aminoacyl-tRNA hydrolase [Chloroflexus sp. MS-CIW-1]
MWLIVGLGNPGERYARTRHNVGFRSVETLAERHSLTFRQQRANSQLAEGIIHGQRVVLVKPQTYMNLSGQAVSALRNWYKIDPAHELLVIYDDLDLPFARIRIRERGSAGTHNGMRSIVAQLGTTEFPRLRVGIGQPPGNMDAADYVLSRFTPEEEAVLPDVLARVADAVDVILREGLITAMNRYNPLQEME